MSLGSIPAEQWLTRHLKSWWSFLSGLSWQPAHASSSRVCEPLSRYLLFLMVAASCSSPQGCVRRVSFVFSILIFSMVNWLLFSLPTLIPSEFTGNARTIYLKWPLVISLLLLWSGMLTRNPHEKSFIMWAHPPLGTPMRRQCFLPWGDWCSFYLGWDLYHIEAT